MLKSLKNDRPSYTSNTNSNINTSSLKDKKNYKSSKPTMYKKVEFEINKEKKYQEFRKKLSTKLVKKYYNRIKFYHKCLKLKRLIRLNKKKLFFDFLFNSIVLSMKMNIKTENKLNYKLIGRYVYLWKKITRIKKIERNFKKDFIVTNGRIFYKKIKNKIVLEVGREFKKLKYFYSLVSYKFRNLTYINQNLKKSNLLFHSNQRRKFHRIFVEKILSNFLMKNHFNNLIQNFSRKIFFDKIKFKLQNKLIIQRIKNIFILKTEFKNFRNFINKLSSLKKEENLISMYYRDKIKMKIFREFNRKLKIKNKYRTLVNKYIKISKISHTINLISIYRTLRNDLEEIKTIYRNYRDEKMNFHKARLINELKYKIMMKSKYNLAQQYYREKSSRRSINILHKNYLKTKFFKMFIKKLNQINNQVITYQTLELMKHISYKNKNNNLSINFINFESLPYIVENLLIEKFERKIKNSEISKIKCFFKESKKVIKNKNNLSKKFNVAEYFYHKRLLIKSFSGINMIRSYLILKKKVKLYQEKKLINKLKSISSSGEHNFKYGLIKNKFHKYLKKRNMFR